MKGTSAVRISCQNDEFFKELFELTYEGVESYVKHEKDVKESEMTISAYRLYSILKEHYHDLESIMCYDSVELKKIINEINAQIDGPKSMVNNNRTKRIFGRLDSLFERIRDNGSLNFKKRYLGIRFYIRENTTFAVLDLVENGQYKSMTLCRNLGSDSLYYGENSYEDFDAVDLIYDKLVELLDTIDNYRSTLPEQVDEVVDIDRFACRPHETSAFTTSFADDIFVGEVLVNSNGLVDCNIRMLCQKEGYNCFSLNNDWMKKTKRYLDEQKMEILKKIAIDVESLEGPIKGIITSQLNKGEKKLV